MDAAARPQQLSSGDRSDEPIPTWATFCSPDLSVWPHTSDIVRHTRGALTWPDFTYWSPRGSIHRSPSRRSSARATGTDVSLTDGGTSVPVLCRLSSCSPTSGNCGDDDGDQQGSAVENVLDIGLRTQLLKACDPYTDDVDRNYGASHVVASWPETCCP